jgi:FADH2 O2-dependent halogenase
MDELGWTAGLIGALYRNMADFETFVSLSLLYFAAASFGESARRLDRTALADGFLLRRHPGFSAAYCRCIEMATKPKSRMPPGSFADEVSRAIDLVNVAGLGDRSRRNWYPALAEDLLAASGKLGVEKAEVRKMLVRVGAIAR